MRVQRATVSVVFDGRFKRIEDVRLSDAATLMSLWAQGAQSRGKSFLLQSAEDPSNAIDVPIGSLSELSVKKS